MTTSLRVHQPEDHFESTVAALAPTTLAAVVANADLQTRVDRKYIVPLATFRRLTIERRADLRCLLIAGRRAFRYESVYFDTPDLACFHQHQQGRRRRFKVRTRTYLDSGECALEVKTKGGRSQTVKHRMPYDAADADRLTVSGRDFLTAALPAPVVDSLEPVLVTRYRRATLLDVSGGRITCDTDLCCTAGPRHAGGLTDEVLIETKSVRAAGPTDRWLWANGVRPAPISKYCVAAALLWPHLPANPWRRTLRRHFPHPPRDAHWAARVAPSTRPTGRG